MYRYGCRAGFEPHRLMLRPRESRDLRLIHSGLTTDPPAAVTWSQDVFGNVVAVARFQDMAETLDITCVSDVELTASAWPVFDIVASAIFHPFLYAKDEWTDLGGLMLQQGVVRLKSPKVDFHHLLVRSGDVAGARRPHIPLYFNG